MKLLIAGGGTGGHVFPGLAMAEELMSRGVGHEAVFVGTERGIEARLVPARGFRFASVYAKALKGKSGLERAKGALALPVSFASALGILRREAPEVVVGVGGYASGALVATASMLRIPTAIHEQNAIAGLTNRLLARVVDEVLVSFSPSPLPGGRSLGNPVRKAVCDVANRSVEPTEPFTILVLGGSQGAHGLNFKVRDAIAELDAMRAQLRVVHQAGARDVAELTRTYAQLGFDAQAVEFIEDMAAAYAAAHVVVSRAGATTVAELCACGRPSILIPFPAATDDHQAANGRALVEAGAAMMFREDELTGAALAQAILALYRDPAKCAAMAQAAQALARPRAAAHIVDALLALGTRTGGVA